MSNFAEEMAEHEEAYQAAESKAGTPLFSEGQHQGIITIARVEPGQYGWQWVLGLKGIDSNTKKPAAIRRWFNVPPKTEGAAGQLKADRALLGDPDSDYLAKLQASCEAEVFIGVVVDFRVVIKPGDERDFTDIYLNRAYQKVDVKTWLESRGFSTGGDDRGGFVPTQAGDEFDGPTYTDDDIPF